MTLTQNESKDVENEAQRVDRSSKIGAERNDDWCAGSTGLSWNGSALLLPSPTTSNQLSVRPTCCRVFGLN